MSHEQISPRSPGALSYLNSEIDGVDVTSEPGPDTIQTHHRPLRPRNPLRFERDSAASPLYERIPMLELIRFSASARTYVQ